MAQESLQRKPGGSPGQSSEEKRTDCYAAADGGCHGGILFYFGRFSYGEPDSEHDICYHQFPGCLLNMQTKRLLRRRFMLLIDDCPNRPVGPGRTVRYFLSVRGDLLRNIPGKRYLRVL